MFANKAWITNGYKKVKNPTKFVGVTDKYEGVLLPHYDFKYQTENFNKITESLVPHQIFPTEIYSASRAGKTFFVVCFNNPNLFWHKYEGEGYGSGQNFIFWKSQKIATTVWIQYTPEQINQLINSDD